MSRKLGRVRTPWWERVVEKGIGLLAWSYDLRRGRDLRVRSA
ncbi:MAG: hypothetical protein R3B99_32345 [Polyangiales bacterium]